MRFILKYTSFIFTDLVHLKLISKWCKNLKNLFIVTFDTPCLMYVCESYDKWQTKNDLGSIFLQRMFFSEKKA